MSQFLKNLNLQFYSADTGNNQGGGQQNQGDNNNQNNNGDQSSADSKNTDNNMIPYTRFKEVNDNYKAVKDQLDQLLKDKANADEDAKKKQGEFESLYNDLKSKHEPLETQFKEYQETFKSLLKTKLESVPENMRDLVPSGSELEQLKWIENAIAKGLFKQQQAQDFGNNGNNPANSNTTVTPEEFAKMTYKQRAELSNTNPTLYRKLAGRP
ncbi:hypothetical protein [Schinkia azotoformans]|uniref:hypothetical protein n=1 Tax=Schinkia azotoformans TaxID=1454 RepID=UPI002DB802AF|nr:hypothetical protein [Schinkia azotoformans]MEC1786079.1 hypothetical protein [Schinkia azotoformans]MED4420115.1 hypothetical protein [Schinkia azotoformans]